MHDGAADARAEVTAAAEAYCRALWVGDTGALARVFHEDAHLYSSEGGALTDWPRETWLERVRSRAPGEGPPDFSILAVDLAAPGMAHVKLEVAVPGRRFTDYLNFLRIGGEWRVVAKLFHAHGGGS